MQKNKIKRTVSILIVSLLIGYSCSIDEGGTTGPEGAKPVTEGIEARIDSAPWKAFNYSAYLCGKQITLTGLDSANGNITITLNDTLAGKTYDLNTTSAHWATYMPNNSTDLYTTYAHPLAGGMVFLSAFNKDSMTISGSFIFYAYNLRTKKTITISEGDFSNISLTSETLPASGIRAYVGDKLWTTSTAHGTLTDENITIQGENAKGEKLFIKICSRLKENYILNEQTCHVASYLASSTDTIPYLTNSSPTVNGKVVISDITADSLIRGSFILSVYRPNDNKNIQITQGVFHGIKLHR
ncbi:MAG: DUF6252 family protein [Bacteroidales bacterium]